jgi:hypothetical protein
VTELTFSPGTLVSARGREWIVLTGSDADTLRVRPISGSEEDQTLIYHPARAGAGREARFPRPTPEQRRPRRCAAPARRAAAVAARGAGPFRSFGQIAVEPRAYQLVPLLMALKLDPVRLLIADDVGVGKTIEAGLIARELLDRGDIERSAVLCPPHLVDQWVTELEARFHIRPSPSPRRAPSPPGAGPPAERERLHRPTPTPSSASTTSRADRRRDNFLAPLPRAS